MNSTKQVTSFEKIGIFDVTNGFKFIDIHEDTLYTGFKSTEGIDLVVYNMGCAILGLVSEDFDLLSESPEYEYSFKTSYQRKYTHENNPQTLKGVFGVSCKPSYYLQPKNFYGKLSNTRMLIAPSPVEIGDYAPADSISAAQYNYKEAVKYVAAADVVISGKGPVGTTVLEAVIWPYEHPQTGPSMTSRKRKYTPKRDKAGVNGIKVAERLLENKRLTGNERRAREIQQLIGRPLKLL